MKYKTTKINKYQPIFRIPKEWINPPEEKRIKIPVSIAYDGNTIVITKETKK